MRNIIITFIVLCLSARHGVCVVGRLLETGFAVCVGGAEQM